MQNYTYSLTVRMWHPSIDPAAITEELGATPKRACAVGERRKTPKGQPLGGVYAETYWWTTPFERDEYLSTDNLAVDALDDVLQWLAPHKSFLQRLRSGGGRIILEVSSYSGRNYAIVFPPEFLAKCADLGLSLAHDVYPYAQNW